jgi:hypothetical protein
MAMNVPVCGAERTRSERKRSIEYQLIFAVSFIIFFLAAVVERLLPWTWVTSQPRHRTSIFSRAWDAAQTCTAYAFMG